MLSADVRFEGFTATDWVRVLSLFQPRRAEGEHRDPDRPRGLVVAVHARGRLRKLVHTEVGRLPLEEAQRDWPLSAEELARRYSASWAMSLEAGTLGRIMERFGARARRGDDLTAQTFTLLTIARDELMAGNIDGWPRRLRGVPVPAPAVVRGTLDGVCPVGKAVVLGLFEGGELWTSIALRRADDGFNLILGPDEVRGDMGLLAGDWRRDYRHLARAIEDRAGPLAFGCFAETGTFRKLEVDPSPGAWARAAAVRDVILSPLPAPMAIPLGIDAGRAALVAMRRVMERMDTAGVFGASLERMLERAAERMGGESELTALLGFHPLELLRKLLSRER